MTKVFDADVPGAILEYGTLFREHSRHGDREAWTKENLRLSDPNVWAGPAFTMARIIELLERGRDPKEVRRTIGRAFVALEANHLIERYVHDDNPNSSYRVVSVLGEELLAEDAHLEFLGGLPYVVKRWRGSVAMVYDPTDSGIGTGFLVAPDVVATAAHVVRGLAKLEVALDGGPVLPHTDVLYPTRIKELDLALIRLAAPVPGVRPFRLSRSAELLDEVVVFGYPPVPKTDDAYLVVNRGEVSAEVRLQGSELSALIVSCLLRGGNSGGPVVNRRGHVVGVVSESLFKQLSPEEQHLNEGLGFAAATKSQWLEDLVTGVV